MRPDARTHDRQVRRAPSRAEEPQAVTPAERIVSAAIEWQTARRALHNVLKTPKGYPDDMERCAAADRVKEAIKKLDEALDNRA